MKLEILTPMMDTVPTAFFTSYVSMMWRLIWDSDIDVSFQFTALKPIDTSRNDLVSRAMKNEPDYIMFLDSDHSFESDLFYKLLRHKKDIVSAMTFQKVKPFYPNARLYKDGKYELLKTWNKGELLNIAGVGMSCALIKADVFRNIPEPWFEFEISKEGKVEYGEDISFCRKAKEKGYEIFYDTSTIVRHIGGDGIGLESYLGSPVGKLNMKQNNEVLE